MIYLWMLSSGYSWLSIARIINLSLLCPKEEVIIKVSEELQETNDYDFKFH